MCHTDHLRFFWNYGVKRLYIIPVKSEITLNRGLLVALVLACAHHRDLHVRFAALETIVLLCPPFATLGKPFRVE